MDIEKLKQKILDLAFKGELIPHNTNNETAIDLLEKIKAEKDRLVRGGSIKASKEESHIFKGEDNCYYEKVGNKTVNIDSDIPFDLPDHWCWVRLKTIGSVVGGGTPSTDVQEYWANGDVVWVTPAYMSSLTSNYIYDSFKKITVEGLNHSSAKLMPVDSIIMSSRAPIGYIGINKVPAATSQGCKSLVPFMKGMSDYLLYAIKASIGRILDASSGTTFDEISGTEFGEILVPLAPMSEQKDIIDIINKSYVEAEKIINNDEDVKRLVFAAKRKVLDLIFSDSSDYQPSINRTKTTLSSLIPSDSIGDGDWVLSENMDENGEYSLVQLKHVGFGCYLNKSYKHVNSDFFESNNCTEIKENYILINRLVADEMFVCLLPKFDFKCITAVDVCWIAPTDKVDQKYLMYYLLAPSFQKKIMMKASGTTRKRISKNNLIKIELCIHDKEYQKQLVDEIESYFDLLDSIAS